MQTIENIFKNSIRDCGDIKNLENFIKSLVFELSYKKIYKLKDKSNIQNNLQELFILFCKDLKSANLYSENYLKSVISGLIDAINFTNKRRIYELYYQKEKIEKEINQEIKNIQKSSSFAFKVFAEAGFSDQVLDHALKDVQLSETQMLGILKEVISEALLTTIEQGQDIEETTQTIVKNLLYQNLQEDNFAQEKVLNVIKIILDEAVELANINQAIANDLLKGAILGSKDAMLKIVEEYKNRLKYTPQEIEEDELKKIKLELIHINEAFIDLLKTYTKKSETISGKIVEKIINEEIDTTIARLMKVSSDLRELVNEKLEEISQDATYRFEQFKESAEELEKNALLKMDEFANNPTTKQVREEAKRLGERAWEAAKEMIKNARETINKNKSH